MKKRLVKLALLSAVLFAAAPASAQSVDDKIKMLEQELTQLKTQQIELKKEATAAKPANPPRTAAGPGAGWKSNLSSRANCQINHAETKGISNAYEKRSWSRQKRAHW